MTKFSIRSRRSWDDLLEYEKVGLIQWSEIQANGVIEQREPEIRWVPKNDPRPWLFTWQVSVHD